MNSLGEGMNRHSRRRKKSVRSVYLRDGDVHAVWKPSKPSVSSPTIPTPPPARFVDVVHEVMRQHGKENLRERQRKLLSRVTATQQVLKEQNEELAAVAELTEEDEEEEEKDVAPRSVSAPGQRDTPGRKMWQHLIKSVIDKKKQTEKDKKRNRKRSTVHFHEVVANRMASMDPAGAGGLPSISEQNVNGVPQVITPVSPQKPRRKTSVPWRRQDAVTPSGAIPFTEWKNHFYERQKLTRNNTFKSDYNLKAQAAQPYGRGLPRINSDNHLTFPVHDRRVSVASGEDLEPRSKSVSQYRRTHTKLRRSSSPDVLDYNDYDDRGEMSDTSVALDDMFSPLSSRSVSPSVFSDEEEQRRSKLQSRTPTVTSRSHKPLVQLDSEEMRVVGNPSNLHKRTRNHYRQQHQIPTHTGDDIIEIDHPGVTQPSHVTRRRPKRVSISLPTSPRGTPSPRPSTPQSHLTTARVGSPTGNPRILQGTIASPSILSDRITREERRRESLPHLAELDEEEQLIPQRRAATPDSSLYHAPLQNRRSSTPTILNPGPPPAPSAGYGDRKMLTPSPPPPVTLLLGSKNEHPRGRAPGDGRHIPLHTPTGNSYMSQTTV